MATKYGFIYLLLFASGRCYVGQTRLDPKTRFQQHAYWAKAGNTWAVYNAWRAHGAPTLQVLGRYPVAELAAAEIAFIAQYDSHRNGYNMTIGGDRSPFADPEIKARATEAMKQTMRSPQLRERLSLALTGVKHSDERRTAISIGHVGIRQTTTSRLRISETMKRLKGLKQAVVRQFAFGFNHGN